MARGKKKEAALSPAERLQAALVPESEQLYQVPKNWVCFYFTSLINIEGGTQPPKSQFINEYREGYIRLVQIRDFASDKYIVFIPDTDKLRHFNEDDILIARYGASLGRICTGMSGAYNVALTKTIFSQKVLNRKYVYWMLQSEAFQRPLTGISRIAQSGFNKDDLSTFAMPLPPLCEQQRIVDRIESLFDELDEAKQKAQDALDSFETRRAAILHKAFTGELTAQWRKEHGVGMESWESHPIKDIAQIGSGGTPSRKNAQYYSGDILWVKTGEICWNGVYDTEEKITEEAINDSSAKLYPAGTVLVAMYGQGLTRGRAAILRVPAATNQAVCALQPYEGLKKEYLYYYFMANYWNYRGKGVGENQPNYSATMIGKWLIQIPTISEQTEIVRILDDLLAKEQQAKEAAEKVLEQIDLTKKAILARAFRGELGTNDPSEESAVELLRAALK